MNSTNTLYQCRLCLKRTPTRVNVFGGDFPKMLEILTSIKVRENDGLPRYSCTKCAQDVKMALIIKKRIIKAHRYLTENLNKRKTDQTTSKIVTVSDDYPLITNQQKVSISLKSEIVVDSISEVQKPIEFVSVSSPKDSDIHNQISKIKTECEEISIKYDEISATETKPDPNETFLNDVIQRIMTKKNKRETTFTCNICDITFTDKASYTLHSNKHKKTTCHVCNRIVRSDNFRKHLMLHTDGPKVCNLCGATCKNIESLRGHMFYQHRSPSDAYVCEECGKKFRIKYKFLLHKRKEHTGIRNFKCETCGKAFFTKGNLMTHVNMTHKKLRPHICEFCGTGFSSSYALKTHKRQHTNEKPYICEYCDEGFRQKVSLRSHLKSKHGIEEAKEFICATCCRGFATNYALSIHERLHASEKCGVCFQSFAEKEYLKNHLKEAHSIYKIENESDKNENEGADN